MALINPEDEDFSSVAAYLKTSASVYGVDDNPKELKVDEGEDDDNCIMPASIKPKYTYRDLIEHLQEQVHRQKWTLLSLRILAIKS